MSVVRRSAAAAAMLAAVACRSPPPQAPPPDELRFAVRADVTGFFPNPPFDNESYTLHVNGNILEGLVRFDRTLGLQPALAERWENPDELTYVFKLRSGLQFSDGSPVTAADVAASLQAARGQRSMTRDYLQAIESVRAVSDLRVEVRTRAPYLILLAKLPYGYILPAAALGRVPVPTIGTGPYQLASWRPGTEFVLERNPRFRGQAPAFGRARFSVLPEAGERIRRVLSGEADVADQIPLERVAELEARDDVRVVVRPSLRVLFLCLRMNTAPFADARVREAVDLAIDRGELIRKALAGRTLAASQIVPPAVVGFHPGIPVTQPDRERARALLAEAGYAAGLSVRLNGTRDRYVNDIEILNEVARQLALVGIHVEVNALDKRSFFPLINSQGSSFHMIGWACESGDAGDALDSLLHSRSENPLGSFNTFGLADPELDRLIDAANRSPRVVDRVARLQRALLRAAALRPVIPLVIQTEAVLLSRRIEWEPPLDLSLQLSEIRRR